MALISPLLSIVIPAYQEEQRIGPTLEELGRFLSCRVPDTVEIIIVSGGSTDRTVSIARRFQNQLGAKLKILDLPNARGKGAAVRAGMHEAAGKFVLFTDADLAYEPKLFDAFVARLQSGADVVIAQRLATTQYCGMTRRWIAGLSRFLVQR